MSLCHRREPCKNGWTNRDAVGVVGSRNHVLDWVQVPMEGVILKGKGRPTIKYRETAVSNAKTSKPMTCAGMPDDTAVSGETWLNRLRFPLGCGLGWAEGNICYMVCSLALRLEYDWTAHVWRRCGFFVKLIIFNHLFFKGQIPLHYRRQVRSWPQTGSKLVADLQQADIWPII